MGNIVLLDDLTINQIAAGEVIERPANVVKELVENSIDAGAKKVVIEIKKGGKELIKITDNGSGIAKDDMLISLDSMGIYTNRDCAFHIHFSFPDIDKKEVAWILCCTAIDEKVKEDLRALKTKTSEIKLFSDTYANPSFLNNFNEDLTSGDYSALSAKLSNIKMRTLRIHPQGTIEWRGPRGFIDANDPEIIKLMIQKIYNVVRTFSKMSNAQEWKGDITINKKDLLSKLSLGDTEFKSKKEEANEDKKKNFKKALDANPELLLSINAKKIEKVFDEDQMIIINALREFMLNPSLFEKMDSSKFNALIDCYVKYQGSVASVNYCSIREWSWLYTFLK